MHQLLRFILSICYSSRYGSGSALIVAGRSDHMILSADETRRRQAILMLSDTLLMVATEFH